MSNDSRPRVVFAELHSEVFLPGVGQLPRKFDTSPKSQDSKLRGLKMWVGPNGIEVNMSGRVGSIPFGNLKWYIIDTPAEAEVEKSKTAKTPFAVTAADRAQIQAQKDLAAKGLSTPSNHPALAPTIQGAPEAKNPVALDEKTIAAVKASLGN